MFEERVDLSNNMTWAANDSSGRQKTRRSACGQTRCERRLFTAGRCEQVPLLCDGVLDLVTGASDNLNLTHLPVQLAHTPAGTSAKNLAHFMQGIRDGHFRRFDYGDEAER